MIDDEIRTTIHEASHVVAAVALCRPFYSVTIVPTKTHAGMMSCPMLLQKGTTARNARVEIFVSLAGFSGECLAFGEDEVPNFSDCDLLDALTWIRRFQYRWTLVDCLAHTGKILASRWKDVEKLAGVLFDEKTLSAKDVRRVLRANRADEVKS